MRGGSGDRGGDGGMPACRTGRRSRSRNSELAICSKAEGRLRKAEGERLAGAAPAPMTSDAGVGGTALASMRAGTSALLPSWPVQSAFTADAGGGGGGGGGYGAAPPLEVDAWVPRHAGTPPPPACTPNKAAGQGARGPQPYQGLAEACMRYA